MIWLDIPLCYMCGTNPDELNRELSPIFVNDHKIWQRNSLNYHQWWWTLAERRDIKLDTSQYFMDSIQGARNHSMFCRTKRQVLQDIFILTVCFQKTDVQPIFPPSQCGLLTWTLMGICLNFTHVGHYVWWLTTFLSNMLDMSDKMWKSLQIF